MNVSCIIINGTINISYGYNESATATAIWLEDLNFSGWFQFHVFGNSSYPSKEIARCAGGLEGYTHNSSLYQQIKLVKDMDGSSQSGYSDEVLNFLQSNLNYIKQSVDSYPDSIYWNKVGIILEQFQGLVYGYNLVAEHKLSEIDFWIYQAEGDMDDIFDKFPNNVHRMKRDHCTGLVRLLDNYSDLYFSHNTWSDFRELFGELKEYHLNIKEFKASTILMSTRIGRLASDDDFYINDQGLFIFETTIGNYNSDLYDLIVPQNVFTWIRDLLSTWDSSSGQEWTQIFRKHNSGTYNNQYVIVDSKRFQKNHKPSKDLIWVLEQIPGLIISKDSTDFLVNRGFYPSFNCPSFIEIFNLSGLPQLISSWGDDGNYWDYNTSSRYRILSREAPSLQNFDQFKKLMRYNNYKKDSYSHGDPGQMILSRYDLRDGLNPHFRKSLFGGLDTKALRLSESFSNLYFHAINSPEYEYNPPFNFSASPFPNISHDGLPNFWKFNWTIFQSLYINKCSTFTKEESCISNDFCGWCIYSQQCLGGDSHAPFYGLVCDAGWSTKVERSRGSIITIILVSSLVVILICVILVFHCIYFQNKNSRLL